MNEIQDIARPRRSTQAAEGLQRWRWTLAEFDRFIELGIFGEDDRVELIGGELVPMAAKGNRHENLRGALLNFIVRKLPGDCLLYTEPGWRAQGDIYVEPDFLICPLGAAPTSADPAEVKLLIEIAASSLKFDTGTKAATYAGLGVRDYWVVNAGTLETRVHRGPSKDGFVEVTDHRAEDALTPLFVPDLAVRLADLGVA